MMKTMTPMSDMSIEMILRTITTLWLRPRSTKKLLGSKELGTTMGGRSQMGRNIYTLTLTGGQQMNQTQCCKLSRGVMASLKVPNSRSLLTTLPNGIQKLTLTFMTSKGE